MPTTIVAAGAMFLAARFSLGDPGLFLLGSAIVGSVAAIDLVLERLGQTTGRDRLFTLLLAIWLPVFAIIGAAAWGSGKYNGEVVGVLALAVVGFVAIVEPAQIVLPWTIAGALMLTLGAAARGGFSGEELVVALVIVVIATFTGRLRGVIEGYQGRRRAVIHEITKVAVGSDPFETAGAILEPLIKRAPSRLGAFVWFTDDDRSLLLAVAGSDAPDYLRSGQFLPQDRNDELRERATRGPWMANWPRKGAYEVGSYVAGIRAAGIASVAYVPLIHRGVLAGVLGIGSGPAGAYGLIEELPVFVEVAEIAGAALAQGLDGLRANATVDSIIDGLILNTAFWPVFQPIRELITNQIVGYEALTRFESVVAGRDLVDHARADLDRRAILHPIPKPAGHADADVVVLTQARPGDGLDVLHPMPPGFEHHPPDDEVVEVVDVHAAEGSRTHLVGALK